MFGPKQPYLGLRGWMAYLLDYGLTGNSYFAGLAYQLTYVLGDMCYRYDVVRWAFGDSQDHILILCY